MALYYIQYHGQTVGPMEKSQLAAYGLTPTSFVSVDGDDWQPVYTYPDLMELCNRTQKTPDPAPAPSSASTPGKGTEDSMKTACGVLAILIGVIGLQYFLIGKTTAGILTIVLSIVTCGAWSLITFIQGILILCMSEEEWRRKFVDSTSTFPIF